MPAGPGALNPAQREAALSELRGDGLDLLIVGGGITGAGAALDAAARGLNVALVEKTDLAAGASSKSSKLIHGGLRYLEMGDIGLVREGLRERELLLSRLAPHLVRPVPFLWPLRHRGWERLYLGAGLALYDSLGGARSVPPHRHLTRRGTLAAAPALSGEGIFGAVQFHDAGEDDARTVVAVVRTAASLGAHIVTRASVRLLVRSGHRVTGALVVDEDTGEPMTVRARHVALAAGAWTDAVRASAEARFTSQMRPSKGIHITVAADRIPMSTGVLARTEKSVLFIIPTDDGWLIGDTDTPWAYGPDEVVATGADVDYLLGKTNALLARPLTRADVCGVFAGVRPLVGTRNAEDTTRLSRKHVIEAALPGLTTIAGGKYTTYRVMAAALIDAVAREFPGLPRSATARLPLVGAEGLASAWERRVELAGHLGSDLAGAERLLRRYGSRVEELVALVGARPELAEPLGGGDGALAAEVVYACTHEGARHVDDVLERRLRLAITRRDRGLDAVRTVAALMAEPLGWSRDVIAREVQSWQTRVAGWRAAEAEIDDAEALRAYRAALSAQPVDRMTRGAAAAPVTDASGASWPRRGTEA